MPVATTSEAARAVASNARARQQAEAAAKRADTTTPIKPAFETEQLPEPPALAAQIEEPAPDGGPGKPKKPLITLSTTVQHRGRVITIQATDITVDRFCDLLDQASYAAPAPAQWHTLPDGTPLCPKHNVPMRKREKQGDLWWSHRVFNADGEELFCKGYHAKDSPGYEV